MPYHAESFHIAGAVMACKRLEAEGVDPGLWYIPDLRDDWPEGMSWPDIARALWDSEDASVDTLAPAPYRVMVGTADGCADDVFFIDVSEEDDILGAAPDYATEYIA